MSANNLAGVSSNPSRGGLTSGSERIPAGIGEMRSMGVLAALVGEMLGNATIAEAANDVHMVGRSRRIWLYSTVLKPSIVVECRITLVGIWKNASNSISKLHLHFSVFEGAPR